MGDVTVPFGFPYPEATDLVRDGAADIEALAEGVNTQLLRGFLLLGIRGFFADATLDMSDPFVTGVPLATPIRRLRVQCVGGGGGSGACVATGVGEFAIATGGNGGEYGIRDYVGSALNALPATISVVVGAGGIGATVGNDDSTDGGITSFHNQTVAGGERGRSALTVGTFVSLPRFASTAGLGINNRVIPGGVGAVGALSSATRITASQGGASHFSPTGNAGGIGSENLANFGRPDGGGASGPTNSQSKTAKAGNSGAGGLVEVEFYI